MYTMAVHEQFLASPAACGGSENWTDPIPQAMWGTWITDAQGEFVDTVGDVCLAARV